MSRARVTFHGHASTTIETSGSRFLTDPVAAERLLFLRRRAPAPTDEELAGADAVLISHDHLDHLDLPTLRRVAQGARVLAPPRLVGLLRREGLEPVGIGPGEAIDVGGVTVRVVEAVHRGARWPWQPERGAQGYVVGSDPGVYFAGDTDLHEGMVDLRGVGVALLPIWGWGRRPGSGHLDPERAATALELIRPRVAVPIHWGTYSPAGPARLYRSMLERPALSFARLAAERAPGVEVRALAPGEATEAP